MRPVVYGLIIVLLLVGLTLTMLPAPVALALNANSMQHTLAPDLYARVLHDLLHGVGMHLNHSMPAGSRHSLDHPAQLGALHRPSCLAGCPPIMHPFVSAP